MNTNGHEYLNLCLFRVHPLPAISLRSSEADGLIFPILFPVTSIPYPIFSFLFPIYGLRDLYAVVER